MVSLAYIALAGFANTLIATDRLQVLDDQWLKRMNVSRRDVGTGMTREECTAFNETINLEGLRGYWHVVGNAVREVPQSVPTEDLEKPVETKRIQRMLEDGTIANERARWLPSFLEGKNKA